MEKCTYNDTKTWVVEW